MAFSTTSRTSRARPRTGCSRIGSRSLKLADEAGFESFHLAEHHGSEPLHGAQPGDLHRRGVADHEDDPPRPDGEAPAAAPSRRRSSRTCASPTSSRAAASTTASAAASRRSSTPGSAASGRSRASASRTRSGIICNAFATGEISSAGSVVPRLPERPARDQALPESDPVLVSGQPGDGRSPRHEPDVRRRRAAEHLRRLRRELGEAPGRHAPARRPRQPAACRPHADPRDRADREGGARDLAPRRRRARAAHEERPHARPPRALGGRLRRERSHRSRRSSRTSRTRSPPAPACRSRSSSALAAVLESGLRRSHRAPGTDRRHDLRRGAAHAWSSSRARSSRSSRSSSAG